MKRFEATRLAFAILVCIVMFAGIIKCVIAWVYGETGPMLHFGGAILVGTLIADAWRMWQGPR